MKLCRIDVFGGVDVLDSYAEHFTYSPHWHDEYVVAIYRDGAKNFKCGNDQGLAQAGDVLIIAPGTIHSAKTLDRMCWDYRSLYLRAEQISDATGMEPETVATKIQDYKHISGHGRLVEQALLAMDAGTGTTLALSEWLLVLLKQLPERQADPVQIPQRLSHVFQRIADAPADLITMSELAALANVTPEHLSRSFKRKYGVSPFQLLIAARIHCARQAISQGAPLAEAAIKSGFSDQSHMTRWIKKAYGVTPSFLYPKINSVLYS